jgi:ribonuclease-3
VPAQTNEERIAALERMLELTFADRSLALSALTHKSYVNEHRDHAATHNERLEFLGDAVVDLVISHRLMDRFPDAHEGGLSKLRAMLVNEESLAKVARALGLGEVLLLGKGEERTGGREKSSVLADALEAVLGAVYRSAGLEGAMRVIDRHFAALFEALTDAGATDYKTRLQERVQAQKQPTPKYRLVGESGPEHAKEFEVEVSIADEVFARARGKSKKEAEQAAARETLETLQTRE